MDKLEAARNPIPTRRRLVFTIVAVALALLAIETAVRLALPRIDYRQWTQHLDEYSYTKWNEGQIVHYLYDPNFNFRLAPGIFRTNKGAIWQINQLGLRGPMPEKQKKPGNLRILVLGESSTFDGSLDTGLSWPDLLQKELSEKTGLPIEVINAGTPGFTSYQSSRRLQSELIDFKPDIVLAYMLWNDMKLWALPRPESLIEQWEALAKDGEKIPLVGRNALLDALCKHSQMVTYLRVAVMQWRLRHMVNMQEGMQYDSLNHSINAAGLEFYRKNLRLIINILAPRGIPLVIIKQATLVGANNSPKEEKKIHYRLVGFKKDALLKAYATGWEIDDELCRTPKVFCLDASKQIPQTLEYFIDQVHLTDQGREKLAQYVAESLPQVLGDLSSFASENK